MSFFQPADPLLLGLIRASVGTLFLWSFLVFGWDLHDYLGSDGWIAPESARAYLAEHSPYAWSFWFLVPDSWLRLVWLVCLFIIGAFALGYKSRVTAILAWIIAISTARRTPTSLFIFDQVISTMTFYLAACGASGRAFSLDLSLRRRRDRTRPPQPRAAQPSPGAERSVSANIGLRLIQLHLVLLYGSAGLAKLMAPEWWNGSAVEMIMLTPEFRRFNFAWLSAYPVAINLMTHGAVLLEVLYPVLIWKPLLRPAILAGIVGMHLGIDLMLGLSELGLLMIAANVSFVPGGWLRTLAATERGEAGPAPLTPSERIPRGDLAPIDPAKPTSGEREGRRAPGRRNGRIKPPHVVGL